ncbi:MAG: sugar efflux transporter [Alicyclobacillaceae bacterium]|nr:sugar efflux transporter [Alicyclobacillaceae bacterium]
MYRQIANLFSIKWYGLFVVCIGLMGVAMSLSSPYLSLYCTGVIGMTPGAFGVLLAVSSACGILVNSLVARRTDGRLDRKYIIMVATLSSACGYIAYLVCHNYFILLIAVGILAGCGAPAMPQIFAYARESMMASGSANKTLATSTLRSLFSLGFLLGPLIGTVVLVSAGYRGLFLGTAVILMGICVVVFVFLKRRPRAEFEVSIAPSEAIAPAAFRPAIRKPFVAFILLYVCAFTYNLNTPLYVVHTIHAPQHDVGLLISVSAGLEIPIMIGLGTLARRFSNQTLMLYGCIIGMADFSLIGLSTHLWAIFAVQLLQASYIGVVMGNGLSYFQDLLPKTPGVATTIYANAQSLGVLIGNLAGGAMAQFAGYRNVYWLCLPLMAGAFVLFQLSKRNQEIVRQHAMAAEL